MSSFRPQLVTLYVHVCNCFQLCKYIDGCLEFRVGGDYIVPLVSIGVKVL